jgi:hypothetical protein
VVVERFAFQWRRRVSGPCTVADRLDSCAIEASSAAVVSDLAGLNVGGSVQRARRSDIRGHPPLTKLSLDARAQTLQFCLGPALDVTGPTAGHRTKSSFAPDSTTDMPATMCKIVVPLACH